LQIIFFIYSGLSLDVTSKVMLSYTLYWQALTNSNYVGTILRA